MPQRLEFVKNHRILSFKENIRHYFLEKLLQNPRITSSTANYLPLSTRSWTIEEWAPTCHSFIHSFSGWLGDRWPFLNPRREMTDSDEEQNEDVAALIRSNSRCGTIIGMANWWRFVIIILFVEPTRQQLRRRLGRKGDGCGCLAKTFYPRLDSSSCLSIRGFIAWDISPSQEEDKKWRGWIGDHPESDHRRMERSISIHYLTWFQLKFAYSLSLLILRFPCHVIHSVSRRPGNNETRFRTRIHNQRLIYAPCGKFGSSSNTSWWDWAAAIATEFILSANFNGPPKEEGAGLDCSVGGNLFN